VFFTDAEVSEFEQTVRRMATNRGLQVFKIEISNDGTMLLSVDNGNPDTRRATYKSFASGSDLVQQVETWLSQQADRPIERRQYATGSSR